MPDLRPETLGDDTSPMTEGTDISPGPSAGSSSIVFRSGVLGPVCGALAPDRSVVVADRRPEWPDRSVMDLIGVKDGGRVRQPAPVHPEAGDVVLIRRVEGTSMSRIGRDGRRTHAHNLVYGADAPSDWPRPVGRASGDPLRRRVQPDPRRRPAGGGPNLVGRVPAGGGL